MKGEEGLTRYYYLMLALHRLHDWLSNLRQHDSDVHLLGNGGLMLLRLDFVLVQET